MHHDQQVDRDRQGDRFDLAASTDPHRQQAVDHAKPAGEDARCGWLSEAGSLEEHAELFDGGDPAGEDDLIVDHERRGGHDPP